MPRRIETVFIDGPVGRIEGLFEEPEAEPVQACIVCHPHPLYRGSMHNKVVYRIAHGFRSAGSVTLRFNYRGVGKSEGAYDHGRGEVEDARAALRFLRERYPDVPYSVAGFSFGSAVALRLACSLGDPKPVRVIPVGIPASRGTYDAGIDCTLPKFFVQSTHDEFGGVADTQAAFARFAGPKQLTFIEARDHFFADALDPFEKKIAEIAGG